LKRTRAGELLGRSEEATNARAERAAELSRKLLAGARGGGLEALAPEYLSDGGWHREQLVEDGAETGGRSSEATPAVVPGPIARPGSPAWHRPESPGRKIPAVKKLEQVESTKPEFIRGHSCQALGRSR